MENNNKAYLFRSDLRNLPDEVELCAQMTAQLSFDNRVVVQQPVNAVVYSSVCVGVQRELWEAVGDGE